MPPEKFGRYEVESQIGDGAMGRVYRAFDPLARRVVAIKTIKSELLSDNDAAEYLQRFRREAQAAGALSHPAIVIIFDIGENFFVMEYLEGMTLHAMVRDHGRLDLAYALRILGPVAEALDYAHRRGVIHRDIKPANIMVLPDGRPKLMDFGVAHIESTVMTKTGQFLGSPSYMAPEQIAGGEITPRADLFSLAVVAYEMLTGKRAFDGSNITGIIYQVVNQHPPPPHELNGDLPPHHDDVFARALAKDPSQRFETAVEMISALEVKTIDDDLARAFDGLAEKAGGRATMDLKEGSPAGAGLLPPALNAESLAPTTGSSLSPSVTVPPLSEPVPERKPARNKLLLPVIGGVVLAGAGALWLLRGERSAETPTVSVSPSETAAIATPAMPTTEPSASSPLPEPTPSGAQSSPASIEAPATVRATAKPSTPPTKTARSPVGVREGDLVSLGPDVTPPKRIAGTEPSYPDEAKRKRLQGTVVVEMIITEKGEPIDIKVVESVGEILDRVVLAAVKTWRFEPAKKDGTKVRVSWRARFSYVSQ